MTSKKFMQLCSLWLLVGILLSLFSCGAVFAAGEPQINSFYATPALVKSGETVTLKWSTSNVARVEILGIEKEGETVPTNGTLEVWPLTTTSYILVAYGTNGTVVSKAFTVNVGVTGTVKIDFFKSNKTVVAPGETVALAWKISNGKSARIIGMQHGDETIINPVSGNLEVWPLATTTYMLEATGLNGEVQSASITINVKENTTNPEILSFVSNKYIISKGEMITLSWTTKNATTCKITTSTGQTLPNRPPNGSISLTPNKTTSFTLIALDAKGNETKKSITVTVK